MKNPALISVIALGLLQISCGYRVGKSDEVKQETIVQNYEVVYSDETQEVEVSARFSYRESNTALELTENSSVELNGTRLEPTEGVYLVRRRDDDAAGDFTFRYRNNDGQVFENVLRIPKKLSLQELGLKGSKSAGFSIEWQGEPLEANEDLVTLINDSSEPGLVANGKVTFEPKHLLNVKVGPSTLQMRREHIRYHDKIRLRETFASKKVPLVIEE